MAKTTTSPAPERTAVPKLRSTGGTQDLDNSVAWVRGTLHSVFGPERGEEHFRKLPAIHGLLWFRAAWERGMGLGEQ